MEEDAWHTGEVTGHPEGRGQSPPTAVRGRLLLLTLLLSVKYVYPWLVLQLFSKIGFLLLRLNVLCSGQPEFYLSVFRSIFPLCFYQLLLMVHARSPSSYVLISKFSESTGKQFRSLVLSAFTADCAPSLASICLT